MVLCSLLRHSFFLACKKNGLKILLTRNRYKIIIIKSSKCFKIHSKTNSLGIISVFLLWTCIYAQQSHLYNCADFVHYTVSSSAWREIAVYVSARKMPSNFIFLSSDNRRKKTQEATSRTVLQALPLCMCIDCLPMFADRE